MIIVILGCWRKRTQSEVISSNLSSTCAHAALVYNGPVNNAPDPINQEERHERTGDPGRDQRHPVAGVRIPHTCGDGPIADMREVLNALIALYGLDEEEIRTVQAQRRADRGGGVERLNLLWTE